jgi:hypothetical protein
MDPHAELGFGPITEGWSDLAPSGRAILGQQPEARVLARFTDGEPLLIERPAGRGLILVSALPTSLDESDFALRPAFLALLDSLVHEAGIRNGAAATRCGTPWELPAGTRVEGPEGPVEPELKGGRLVVEPALAGRYRLQSSGQTHVRNAVIDPEENLRQPRKTPAGRAKTAAVTTSQEVDVSREVAVVVLLLSLAELILRVLIRARNAGSGSAARRLA